MCYFVKESVKKVEHEAHREPVMETPRPEQVGHAGVLAMVRGWLRKPDRQRKAPEKVVQV